MPQANNVIWIMCDQLRYDYLGCTGHPTLKTPNIDALAAAMVAVTKMSEDRLSAARECLNVISSFTPERAAAQILDGCMTILGDGPSSGRSAAA